MFYRSEELARRILLDHGSQITELLDVWLGIPEALEAAGLSDVLAQELEAVRENLDGLRQSLNQVRAVLERTGGG